MKLQSTSTRNYVDRGRWAQFFLALFSLVMLSLACTIGGTAEPESSAVASQVAATLTAVGAEATQPAATNTPPPSQSPTSDEPQQPSPTPSLEPPSDGVSLNCDGTYQRVRVIDRAQAGQSIVIDQWTRSGWQTEWEFDGGDPAIRQITERAGAHRIGACQQLVAAPLLYTGSGAVLELHIFEWVGDEAVEVYSNNGTHGDWHVVDDSIRFERSLYLYDEPNCCPCNREIVEHEWNGNAFIKVETEIRPTYTGTPPPICQP